MWEEGYREGITEPNRELSDEYVQFLINTGQIQILISKTGVEWEQYLKYREICKNKKEE